ncbi:hypothetical protein BY458DRAFT_553639 [Sporodiniella umbellata]|nr:hypothetical protein BY458DRAFT_553639 [Sporodiniella umbellata]
MSECENCVSNTQQISSLQQELKQKDEQLNRLTLDLQALNQKYVAEIERVGNIQHEKDCVEHELEELSRKLFEEANEMVAAEKRARHQLETELKLTQEHLAAEKNQLHELRLRLLEPTAQTAQKKRKSKAKSMPALPQKNSFDDVQIDFFRDFVAMCVTGTTVKKIHQSDFMKHCLHEDIEPCLRFGPQSKMSAKKMIESFSRQPCFIQLATEESIQQQKQQQQQSTTLWNRKIVSSSPRSICSACGRSSGCTTQEAVYYQFRLDEADHWLLIDQYCRDRIVAVCEFFVFIRNIQLGLYCDRSTQDLYSENIRLRLQMFYSRMGALPELQPTEYVQEDEDEELATAAAVEEEGYLSDSSSLAGPNTPETSRPSPLANQYSLDALIK